MPLECVALYDSGRTEVCLVEVCTVTPPWELICWRGRDFLWRPDEEKYVECTRFFATSLGMRKGERDGPAAVSRTSK